TAALSAAALAAAGSFVACKSERSTAPAVEDVSLKSEGPMNPALISSGQTIFRFDTFGDETFWTDTLRMHEIIRTSVSPNTALSVGLKVDVDALPDAVKTAIQTNGVDLNAPATTV